MRSAQCPPTLGGMLFFRQYPNHHVLNQFPACNDYRVVRYDFLDVAFRLTLNMPKGNGSGISRLLSGACAVQSCIFHSSVKTQSVVKTTIGAQSAGCT